MKIVETAEALREARREVGGVVGFVPTMGALHAGHVALLEAARGRADHVLASVFVNPTQFGSGEDLARYPRPIEADLAKCEAAGVDVVFVPKVEELYPANRAEVMVDVPGLTGVLEGRHRPGHFRGVCLIVTKLLNLVRPDLAFFGLKDYQQFRVIEALATGLDLGVEIVGCPTVREADGLALSSRNVYLSPDERRRALAIPNGLTEARRQHAGGVTQTNRLISTVRNMLLDPGDLGRVPVSIDYVAAVDGRTLRDVQAADEHTVLLVAARVGRTRLIDNVALAAW